ncbi:MAG: thioredoxin-disulfide reductase [Candidatus Dojkabacteria bacterium]|nr:thioredoxin-disulfide reductase [Candidatus Dojkabacteria bacterium]
MTYYENCNVVVIGSGPAGLTSCIYLSRARLDPILLAGVNWGGQLMRTSIIENYPGFPNGIDGPSLIKNMLDQAINFGTKVYYENAKSISMLNENLFEVYTENTKFISRSVLIATGAEPKTLDVPGEKEFWGKGVSTCATCDGALFKNKYVVVVGGGDSAMEEALFLSKFATKVTIIHRREIFKASMIMQEKVNSNAKIEKIMNSEILEIVGKNKVEGVKIKNKNNNEIAYLACDGVFLAIGHKPITSFLNGIVETTEEGYILSHNNVFTSREGIFVAGDVEDNKYRQAITAAGNGCKAALEIEKWLRMKYNI